MTLVDTRPIPIRFSALKQIALSPAHCHDAIVAEREDTLAMRIGRGVHAMLFDQPITVWEGPVRRGKAWDAFKAEHDGEEILNVSERDQSKRIADAVKSHEIASRLLFDGTRLEHRFDFRFMGRLCRATPDAFGSHHLVDLKTHRRQDPERFVKSATFMAYHAQVAWYQESLRAASLSSADDVYIVAVESIRPFPVTVYKLSEGALDMGRRAFRLWFEQLLGCEQSNQWPAYAQDVIPFHVEEPTVLVFPDEDNPPDPDWVTGDNESEAA